MLRVGLGGGLGPWLGQARRAGGWCAGRRHSSTSSRAQQGPSPAAPSPAQPPGGQIVWTLVSEACITEVALPALHRVHELALQLHRKAGPVDVVGWGCVWVVGEAGEAGEGGRAWNGRGSSLSLLWSYKNNKRKIRGSEGSRIGNNHAT